MKQKLSDISKDLNRHSQFDGMPSMVFITDRFAVKHPENIIDTFPAGSMVILRDYDDGNRHNLGAALHYICQLKHLKFIVAGDVALSLVLGADGIHLPEKSINQATDIRKHYPDYFITASVHNEAAIRKAIRNGVDAVLLSPVFSTLSHPETIIRPELTLGPKKVKQLCKTYEIPIYGLGGITIDNAYQLYGTGLCGIAAIRGFENDTASL
jgi:thiamine-phosphate pyrophosphorylase